MPTRGIKPYATPQDVLEYENRAEQEAQQLALNQLADVDSASNIVTRQAIASEDLNAYDDGVTAAVSVDTPEWVTTGQGSAGWYGWYSVEDNNNAEDKGVVIWGLEFVTEDETSALPFSALRVKNSTGGLLDIIDIESVDVAENGRLLLENPITSSTQDILTEIYETADATVDTEYKIKPLVTVGEEIGDTLEDSSRFIKA